MAAKMNGALQNNRPPSEEWDRPERPPMEWDAPDYGEQTDKALSGEYDSASWKRTGCLLV